MISTQMSSSKPSIAGASQVVALALSEALDSHREPHVSASEPGQASSNITQVGSDSAARTLISWFVVHPERAASETATPIAPETQAIPTVRSPNLPAFTPLKPIRQWLDNLEVRDRKFAHFLCRTIPSQCPFERDIQFLGKTLLHIPPLCKLNPFYDEVVHLRFRAMSYLADECGEDISAYY